MKKVSKLNISIALLVLASIALVGAVYAWFFATGGKVNDLIITVGKVDAKVNFFSIEDFNKDGIIDDEEKLTELTTKDYPYMINNLKVGDINTFMLKIQNAGTTESKINFYIDKIDIAENNLARAMSIEFLLKDENGNLVNQGYEKMLLYKDGYGSRIELNYNTVLGQAKNVNLYFQIRFEDLDTLKSLNPDYFSQMSDMNQFQEQTFKIPQFIIRIEQNA